MWPASVVSTSTTYSIRALDLDKKSERVQAMKLVMTMLMYGGTGLELMEVNFYDL